MPQTADRLADAGTDVTQSNNEKGKEKRKPGMSITTTSAGGGLSTVEVGEKTETQMQI